MTTQSMQIKKKIHELARIERAAMELEIARRDVRSISISMFALHHAGLSEDAARDLLARLASIEDELLHASNAARNEVDDAKGDLLELVAKIEK